MPAVNPQPKTLNTYEPNGTGSYSFTFQYERESDVRVGLYNPTDKKFERTLADDPYNPWVFSNATTIQFTNGDPVEQILIYRATDINDTVSEFYTGSAIRAQDLNANFTQLLFSNQELTDQVEQLTSLMASNTPINILPGIYPDDIPDVGDLNPGDSLVDSSGNIWIWNGEIWVNGGPGGGTNGKGWTNGSYDPTTGIVTFTSNDGLGFETTDLRGAKGEQGVDGNDGTSATINVGTTTTLDPGTDATVVNRGTTLNGIFDFGIPKGLKGDKGEPGDDGQDGTSIIIKGTVPTEADLPSGAAQGDTYIAEDTKEGYVWDGTKWVNIGSLEGPEGEKGDKGDKGDGYTSGGYNSTTGAVSFTGDPSSLSFTTGDLRGADGQDGKGWTSGGYNSGTGVVTFNSSDGLGFATGDIRGDKGDKGDKGDSYTSGGYNSTTGVVNFASTDNPALNFQTEDLRGADGQDGQDGTAATVDVGTTTTLPAGSQASVTNSGDTTTAVFDFSLPRGDTGDKGDKGDKGDSWSSGSYDSATGIVSFSSTDNPSLNFQTTDIRGEDGDDGDAATITVGSTTTSNPGTSAAVTNSGNSSAAVLNFTIPRGDKGDQGDPGPATVGTLQQVTDTGNTTTNDIAIGTAPTRSFAKFKDLLEFLSADLIRDHADAIAAMDLDEDFSVDAIADQPFRQAVEGIVRITSGAINLNANGSATFAGTITATGYDLSQLTELT